MEMAKREKTSKRKMMAFIFRKGARFLPFLIPPERKLPVRLVIGEVCWLGRGYHEKK